jgi:hypothetical protein
MIKQNKMVQSQSYMQMLCNLDDFTWEEDPRMVIDFDGEDEDEYEPIINCRTHSFNNTLDAKKMDTKFVYFAATSFKSMLYNDHCEGITKTKLVDQQAPCLDLYGKNVLRTEPNMQRPLFEFPYPSSSDNGKEDCEIMSFDQKLEIAQKKLEDSIRRSQLTRPKFIQVSECILKKQACATLLREIELDQLKQPNRKFHANDYFDRTKTDVKIRKDSIP